MSLSTNTHYYMAQRDSLSADEHLVIDSAFDNVYNSCRYFGIPAAGDDRAAELEAALIKFIIDSRG